MKYILVSTSVQIKNKVFRKSENKELDDSKLPKEALISAYKSGFIKPKGTKAETPKEVKAQYLKELEKESEKPFENPTELPDDMPGIDALIAGKILTIDQLKEIDDFSKLKGIGAKTDASIKEWMKINIPEGGNTEGGNAEGGNAEGGNAE